MSMPVPKHNPDLVSSSSSSSTAATDNFSLASSSSSLIPPGYQFVPTDEDVIFYYLKRFLQGIRNIPLNVPIHRVNIYESTPEQLSKEYKKGNEKEWFFITERTKKSEGGKNQIRSDNGGGYWKATQAAKKIEAGHGVVGYKTALEYHIGKATNSVKADWLMHEYSCNSYGHNDKVDHALCKIYLTPKGAKRRAEEEENEKKKKKKMKIEEVVEALREEVDQPPQFSLLTPEPQQQPRNQIPLDSHQLPQWPNMFIPDDDDDEMIKFQPQPEIPDDDDDDVLANYMGDFEPQVLELDAYEEFLNCGFLDDEFDEMINFQPQPVFPDDDAADYLADFDPQLPEVDE